MSTSITTIQSTDLITNSRADINNNFDSLLVNKLETSVLDTDTTLAADSDAKVPTQKAVKAYIDGGGDISITTKIVPTGAILPYGGATAPSNFLLCNGSAVSRTTYVNLFAILSTSYGVGDGSTTFNLPNLQGRFPLGYSASAPTKVLTFASRSSNVITVTGLDDHAHNELQTGQAVLYTAASGAMTGLTHNTTYYVIRVTSTTFSLATSVANANAGTAITLSSDGTGAQTFTLTYTARPLGQTGGEEKHSLTSAELPANSPLTFNSGTQDGTGEACLVSVTGYGGGSLHNNMPLFAVVNYIIKT
jgi:microcystin-dependent protein